MLDIYIVNNQIWQYMYSDISWHFQQALFVKKTEKP